MSTEADELRAELARLWDAVGPLLPPYIGARVVTTVSHPAVGIPKGHIGFVAEVKGRIRIVNFGSSMILAVDVANPQCGVEWGRQ